MRRTPGPRPEAIDPGLTRLDGALPRRRESVRLGRHELVLETLDDLDQAIDEIMRTRPPGKDPAAGVAEICPHFGVVWPAAAALCAQLDDHAQNAGVPKSVLELGCGLALPSLIARKLGATKVVASDRHELVPQFLRRNAALNRLDGIEYRELDWRQRSDPLWSTSRLERFELILGSDLLYEAWQPGHLAHTLALLMDKPGSEAWIADPGRRYVDTFLVLAEAVGLRCHTEHSRSIEHGRSRVDVRILVMRRD